MDFSSKTKINVHKLCDEQYFLILCMGLIKYHLNKLPVKQRKQFDVVFYDGGLGGNGVDIIPVKNPDASITFGCCSGNFGCSSMISSENGITGNFSMEMKKNIFTLDELNLFIVEVFTFLFVKNDINEIVDKKIRETEFRKYNLIP
jgi:hypothetical protein